MGSRDQDGTLNLYKREPRRGGNVFINTSAMVSGAREAMPHMLPQVVWENSPVCLAKLLEQEG